VKETSMWDAFQMIATGAAQVIGASAGFALGNAAKTPVGNAVAAAGGSLALTEAVTAAGPVIVGAVIAGVAGY
jgi:hypothetical protein